MPPPTIRDPMATDEAAWRGLWSQYNAFYETHVSEAVTAHTWGRILDPASSIVGRLAVVDGAVVGLASACCMTAPGQSGRPVIWKTCSSRRNSAAAAAGACSFKTQSTKPRPGAAHGSIGTPAPTIRRGIFTMSLARPTTSSGTDRRFRKSHSPARGEAYVVVAFAAFRTASMISG